jgi:acyl-CoA synthetase (AMP-forming)/AMP-acid ligase II
LVKMTEFGVAPSCNRFVRGGTRTGTADGASPRSATRVVLAAPDPILGEVPRAVVALKPGAEVSAEALLAFLRPALATFKLPRSIAFVTAVPRSASGKALRRLL